MFGVVSLTMGNSRLPFADRRRAHAKLTAERFLRQAARATQFRDSRAELILHLPRLPASIISKRRVLRNGSVFNPRTQQFNRRSSAV